MTKQVAKLLAALIGAEVSYRVHLARKEYQEATNPEIEYGRWCGIDPRTVRVLEDVGLVDSYNPDQSRRRVCRLRRSVVEDGRID